MQKNLSRQTYKIFWQHAKRYPFALFVIISGVLLGTLVNLMPALFYKEFFDVLQTAGGPSAAVADELVSILFKILGIFLTSWVIWRVLLFVNNYFQPRVMRDLMDTCFAYLHKHSPSYFHNNFVGSLVKRVNKFSRSFEGIADLITFDFLRVAIDIVAITIVLGFQNVKFAAVLVVWVVILMFLNYVWSMYKLPYDTKRSEQDSKKTGILADSITNHDNIKLFNGYEREKAYFGEATERLRYLNTFTWNLGQYFETFQVLMMFFLEFGMMYLAVILWKDGLLTLGDFVLIQTYVLAIFHKMWNFGRHIRNYYEHMADAKEMTEIFVESHAIVDVKNAKELCVEKGKIVFDSVSFSYNKTRRVIRNFNLTIKPGERIALVGHSGAGKSTIVKLLLRSHDVSSGKIFIDGQKISHVTLESLWQNVSYVPQDPILFHRTLMENIRYGRPDATDEEVVEAAGYAHAHEFIESFPEKYDTYVGERGVKLSGGERQRVAIARAILKNSPILILDEATSSLDSESERLIQDALAHLMEKKTVIVVAHRLSTIMAMDRILVVEEGVIAEEGTHKQLLKKKGGFYKKLWEIQAGKFIGE
jgi:ATP-binding cassette, subfamily B, bacterial